MGAVVVIVVVDVCCWQLLQRSPESGTDNKSCAVSVAKGWCNCFGVEYKRCLHLLIAYFYTFESHSKFDRVDSGGKFDISDYQNYRGITMLSVLDNLYAHGLLS